MTDVVLESLALVLELEEDGSLLPGGLRCTPLLGQKFFEIKVVF
jgi:hypothetical protein